MAVISLFDEEKRLEKISSLGDNLEKLNKIINWEIFRDKITKVFYRENKGVGRPPFDYILMFKILILQRLFNLSDDQTEYQILDRSSFRRFLGIETKIPDAKTIWHFKDELTKAGIIKELFKIFEIELENKNIISHSGSIVDATFIEAPRQRNDRDENKAIKKGEIPKNWVDENNINKIRQKDIDARWAVKANINHYGYKNHIKVDADSKFITNYVVTSANVHDSQKLNELLDEKDKVVYADSAYVGIELENKNIDKKILDKGYRNKQLSDEQIKNNYLKSKTRCRIEHVFGFVTKTMFGKTVRSIGIRRAEFNIGLTNLIYNMFRYNFIILKN